MEWNYRDDLPIYSQLVELLKKAIASGEFKPGERLKSVRDLAMEAGVNPNTMQRALTELEYCGLIRTQRTAGRFVTDDMDMISTSREYLAKEKIAAFMSSMRQLGYSDDEIREMIGNTQED